MKELSHYVSFDLEFNQFEGKYHIIQVSAVRFADGQEVAHYDSYAYTDKPLKAFPYITFFISLINAFNVIFLLLNQFFQILIR